MSLRVTLEFSDKDLEHFRALASQAMANVEEQPPEVIVEQARALLKKVDDQVASDYIRDRLGQLRVLIDMLEDEGWGMKEVGRGRVLSALAYFVNAEDLIPDHVPGVGLLDDAIIAEMLCRELKPEMDAYNDFVDFRNSEAERRGVAPESLNRTDYLESCEQALLGRMRRRRRSGVDISGPRLPFSIF